MADDKRYMGYWIGHLHEGERNRIHSGGLNPQESAMLAKGEDPWAKFRGPLPPHIPAYLPPEGGFDGQFKDIQPDELKKLELQTDVDKAVDSLEKNRVQSPEEQAAILSEERMRESARSALRREQIERVKRTLRLSERDAEQFLDEVKSTRPSAASDAQASDNTPPDNEHQPQTSEPHVDDETRELWGVLSNAEEQRAREEREQQKQQRRKGVRFVASGPSQTAKQQEDSELRRFMPKQVREEYNKGDSRQRQVIWEANKRAFKAAQKREKEKLARDQKHMEEVFDLLQQVKEWVKEDPSKADLLPPDDASTSDLRKWYQKMQEPKRSIPFPGVVDPNSPEVRGDAEDLLRQDQVLKAIFGSHGTSDASGQAELLRQREKMREEDRRRADLRKQKHLVERGASLWPGVDEEHGRRMQAAFEGKPEGVPRSPDSQPTPTPPTDPPWHKRADLVLAIILFCLGGVLAIGLLLLPRDSPGAIIFWLAIMFCLLAACALLFARFFDLSKPKTVASLLVPAILVAVFGWYIWPPPQGRAEIQKPIPSPDSSPSPSPSASVQPSPKTLHEYFIEEIYQSATDELPLKVKVKGKDIPVEARIYMNFNNKSVFLGFYIPDTEHTTEVCQHLLRGHTGVLAAFVQLLQDKVEVGPIEGRKTQVKDLRFTKYLIIYHERSIPQSRKDLLDAEAKRLGLLVEYHSQEYVMARWK